MIRDRSLLFKLTATGFLVIGVLGLLWISSGWYFLSAANRAAEIRDVADQVFVDLLQVRRAEKNFLLRDLAAEAFYAGEEKGQTPSLENHQQRVTVLQSDIERLEALLPEEKTTLCTDLAKAVKAYDRQFATLVTAYRKRGFDEWGYAGQVQASAADIEEILNGLGNADLFAEYLELRRREKNYLLQDDPRYIDQVKGQIETLRNLVPAELTENSSEILGHLKLYEAAFENYQTQVGVVGGTEDEGLRKDLSDAVDAMEPLVIDPETGIRKYAEDKAEEARRNLVISQIVILVVGVAGASLLLYLLGRVLTGRLANLVQSAHSIAQGDLTQSALGEGGDETGRLAAAFNKMVVSLRNVLAESKALTGEVATASSEIATGAQQQLASLNQTATSLNEITTTAEQFKATMQEFADRARAVREAAEETAQRTAEGRTLTRDAAARIEQVRVNSQAAGESVLSLSQQMQRIGEITATVHEIAEQTKLLALNASIEAARAGEDGRGFAVVATQVRELANQSKESAGRIESLISDTQKSMQDVVAKIEQGSRLSEDSVAGVRQMAEAFEEIANAISQTSEAMSQINAGAKQQGLGINELVSSITEIDTASKESVSAAEQTQNSIVAVDQRIQSLNASIARFKT